MAHVEVTFSPAAELVQAAVHGAVSAGASRQTAAAVACAALRCLCMPGQPEENGDKVAIAVDASIVDRLRAIEPTLQAQKLAASSTGRDCHSARRLVADVDHLRANVARHAGFNSDKKVTDYSHKELKQIQRGGKRVRGARLAKVSDNESATSSSDITVASTTTASIDEGAADDDGEVFAALTFLTDFENVGALKSSSGLAWQPKRSFVVGAQAANCAETSNGSAAVASYQASKEGTDGILNRSTRCEGCGIPLWALRKWGCVCSNTDASDLVSTEEASCDGSNDSSSGGADEDPQHPSSDSDTIVDYGLSQGRDNKWVTLRCGIGLFPHGHFLDRIPVPQ